MAKKKAVETKLADQLNRLSPNVWRVIEDFADVEPGGSLDIHAYKGVSLNSLYSKLYHVKKDMAHYVEDDASINSDVELVRVMNEFSEWRQTKGDGYMTLHKPSLENAAPKVNDLVEDSERVQGFRETLKEAKRVARQLERDREFEERQKLLESFKEEEGEEEESSNLELPPSAGKAGGDDDVDGDDWLAALMGKK